MDDRETELSRFRQQWKDEVTAHTRPTASSSPKKPPARPFTCHISAPDGEDGSAEHEISPVALQRPRVDVVPGNALEHYEMAVEKEAQGSLGESLSLYRKAFRMDAKVDSQYREKHFPRTPTSTAACKSKGKEHETETETNRPTRIPSPSTPHPNALPSLLATNSTAIATLIASFAHLSIPPAPPPSSEDAPPTTDSEPPFSPLTTLPSELLLHILRDLALADVASFARCAQVCKALAFLVVTEQSIWRDVCTVTYKRMLWDWKVSVNGDELHRTLSGTPPRTSTPSPDAHAGTGAGADATRTIPNDSDIVQTYHSNWRKMFLSRPRIRFNGIYISTCNYMRSGASQSGWNTPVHTVTYYRYLRFYPDGTALSLLSSNEPAVVVPAFSVTALGGAGWMRYVSRGRWRVDPRGRVDVETVQRGMEKYLFRMQLSINSARAGGGCTGSNKLAWEGFWSWNMLMDDLAEFSLRDDKAFFFSRVGSIEREPGIL